MGVWLGVGKVRVMVMIMDIVGVRVREPIRNGMRIAIHASGRIWVRVRDENGVMGRVRVRVWDRVRVMERLVGVRVGVGRPIGKGKRIAIQASSSLLLPDPRMSAAKAALVRREVGVSVRGVRVGVRDRIRVG